MNNKPKLRNVFLLVLWMIIGLCVAVPLLKFGLRGYDAARLSLFAHRIVDTDHITVTMFNSLATNSISGNQAKKIVQAVSLAKSDRPPLGLASSCAFLVKATFLKGTNVLDDIEICGSAFLIHGKKPPFHDGTELLDTEIFTPISKAAFDLEMKKSEVQ